MGVIRWILSGIVHLVDRLFRPRFALRPAEDAAQLATQLRNLSIYQFVACPFCVKVRWGLRRLGLDIDLRDAKRNPTYREELQSKGGKVKVPCLRIAKDDGSVEWLYESSAILDYLGQQFPEHRGRGLQV